MKLHLRALLMTAPLALAACANLPDPAFHPLALYSQQPANQTAPLSLPFQAYVVGVEKDKRARVGAISECPTGSPRLDCLNIDAEFFTSRPSLRDALRKTYLDQFRPTFISHIARFEASGEPCFLVNDYDSARPCMPDYASLPGESKLVRSFSGLQRLGEDMNSRLALLKPSHVIVYSMGWNTQQLEALDNFRRLVRHLEAAAHESGDTDFKPMVIGLTWPSTGSPTITGSDYGIKAKDADEVGATWANVLVNRELRDLKAKHGFRLVVIGHSFGARLTSRAVFTAPLVSTSTDPIVDLLIGLQGAYSFQRFLSSGEDDAPEGMEGAPYRDHARQAGLVALTTSRWDSAVTKAGHAGYFVGSSQVYERTRQQSFSNDFAHGTTDGDGRLSSAPSCDPRRVLMVEASAVIVGNEPGTGGGAHSMIYTPQIGRLTYDLIKACAG